MTDLRELAETQVGALTEVRKAEFTPDDLLRSEIEQLQSKLATERETAVKYRAKYTDTLLASQTVASAMFDLMESEIVACFEKMLEESSFERRLESMIEDGLNRAGALTDEDVTNQIDDYLENSEYAPLNSSSFDHAVRDVVREMIRDGDIVLSIDCT
jgi:predicted Holliday junction resolvase-like endonuclease